KVATSSKAISPCSCRLFTRLSKSMYSTFWERAMLLCPDCSKDGLKALTGPKRVGLPMPVAHLWSPGTDVHRQCLRSQNWIISFLSEPATPRWKRTKRSKDCTACLAIAVDGTIFLASHLIIAASLLKWQSRSAPTQE